MYRHAWLALATVFVLAAPGTVSAAETDTVVLLNGNRLVGEVKGLRQGSLEFKTTTMSTVYIKWNRVGELTAPRRFEVETSTGEKYLGTLRPAGPGKLGVVASDGRETALDMESVVKIRPLSQSVWERLDGSISFGASYTRSSGVGQGTLNANVGSVRGRDEWSASLSQTITVSSKQAGSSRTVSTLTNNFFLPHRWFLASSVQLDRNPDLGYHLRGAGGAGVGRNLIQTNRSAFSAQGGVIINRERPVSGETTTNVEAMFGTNYSYFTYDRPKTNVKLSCDVYPSLTVARRIRVDSNASVSREIYRDFTVGMTMYDSVRQPSAHCGGQQERRRVLTERRLDLLTSGSVPRRPLPDIGESTDTPAPPFPSASETTGCGPDLVRGQRHRSCTRVWRKSA